MSATPALDPQRGVYGISVAADLVGMGVQNLRLYEARGLVQPARTEGGTRRYSADDLDRLRRIGHPLGAGLNLTGISMVLDLEAQNVQLRADRPRALEHQALPRRDFCEDCGRAISPLIQTQGRGNISPRP